MLSSFVGRSGLVCAGAVCVSCHQVARFVGRGVFVPGLLLSSLVGRSGVVCAGAGFSPRRAVVTSGLDLASPIVAWWLAGRTAWG